MKTIFSKLTDADSEQLETQHWIGTAVDCHYWNTETANSLLQQCAEIGRLLNGMIAKSSKFCGESARTTRESSAEYFINNTSDQ